MAVVDLEVFSLAPRQISSNLLSSASFESSNLRGFFLVGAVRIIVSLHPCSADERSVDNPIDELTNDLVNGNIRVDVESVNDRNDEVEVEICFEFAENVDSDVYMEVEIESMSSEYTDDSLDFDESELVATSSERRSVSPVVDAMLNDDDCPKTPLMSEEDEDEDEDELVDVSQGKEPVSDAGESNFRLLETFKNAKEFRHNVEDHSIASHRPLKFKSAK